MILSSNNRKYSLWFKPAILFLLSLFFIEHSLFAEKGGPYPFAISIASPVELPSDPEKKVYGVHLGMFYAQAKTICGFGWVWLGAYKADDKFAGWNIAHVNIVDRIYGVQNGTFVNIVRLGRGVQVAGIVNVYKDSFYGLQGGLVNGGGKFIGLQIGCGNANNRNFYGWQVGGIYNGVNEKMYGLQTGLVNYSKVMNGVQVGLLNISKECRGIPIGLINVFSNANIDIRYVFDAGRDFTRHEIQLRVRGSLGYHLYSIPYKAEDHYSDKGNKITRWWLGYGVGMQPYAGNFFGDLSAILYAFGESFFNMEFTTRVMLGYSFFHKKMGISIGGGYSYFGKYAYDDFSGLPLLHDWNPHFSMAFWFNISNPEGRLKHKQNRQKE